MLGNNFFFTALKKNWIGKRYSNVTDKKVSLNVNYRHANIFIFLFRLKKKKGSFFQSITSLQKNSAKVSTKRDQLEEKSTGARNDYLLSLAAANAHQRRYFLVDLQTAMQIMENSVYERVAEYLTLIARTELLTCSATQTSFTRIRDQAQQVRNLC